MIFFEKYMQCLLYAILVLGMSCRSWDAFADPRLPDDPSEPRVNLNDKKDVDKSRNYQVVLVNANDEKVSGILVLAADYIEFGLTENKGAVKKKIFFSAVERIEFLKWRGIGIGANEFVFHPVQIKFILSDNSTVECLSNIKALNKLTVMDGKKKRTAYSYFYDYWENDAWRNSGQPDKLYPETKPNAGTVVRITFNR